MEVSIVEISFELRNLMGKPVQREIQIRKGLIHRLAIWLARRSIVRISYDFSQSKLHMLIAF